MKPYLIIIILIVIIFPQEKGNENYKIVNDLVLHESPNLPVYYQFETSNDWLDVLKDPKNRALSTYCKTEIDIKQWSRKLDFESWRHELSKDVRIDREKLEKSITLIKTREEEAIVISKPVIIDSTAAIYQKIVGTNMAEYIFILEKKGDKWKVNCRITMTVQFVD